jgi:hypothetical protein
MWLQPGEYTGDCNILYMWLQQLMCSNCKNMTVAKIKMWMIACTLKAV